MDHLITDRLRGIDASGIRRVFDLAADLEDPINLSIGQPDFDVPDPIRHEAIAAIERGENSYTQTQGTPALREAIAGHLHDEFPGGPYDDGGPNNLLVTSGVSGGLVLALMTCAGPGDEVLMPDPGFVMYRHLVTLSGATPVMVDTYPDFELTAERVAAATTERTKMLLFNSPSNPTGVVAGPDVCRELAEFCRDRGILLLSDEIYDDFCYAKQEREGRPRCPSPAAFSDEVLLLRGFSKTYAMTGWRMGYAAGPAPIIEQMTKLQQYSFVCAPSMVQAAGVTALETDMSEKVAQFARRRDRVVERLGGSYRLTTPRGAFYAFPEVPEHLSMTATDFVERAVANNLLIIPGSVFSDRDTHFRISYACDDAMLDRGLDVLVELAGG
ncbi:MAG: aminotransferase class I/II-fold pyridoxal phosphate-dependent enzyme [Phycisphaeraceae bacterium]|nr:aminotransferase class I/II-fold pyridoxal phosphate-dependent enzyme [Phycisphaeraceae bacterium]